MLRDVTHGCVALETNKIPQVVALELLYVLVAIENSQSHILTKKIIFCVGYTHISIAISSNH